MKKLAIALAFVLTASIGGMGYLAYQLRQLRERIIAIEVPFTISSDNNKIRQEGCPSTEGKKFIRIDCTTKDNISDAEAQLHYFDRLKKQVSDLRKQVSEIKENTTGYGRDISQIEKELRRVDAYYANEAVSVSRMVSRHNKCISDLREAVTEVQKGTRYLYLPPC